ncbi:hypothetical protein [Lentilactobacillus otakiensis]|uniref:Uncharacterized protein n=1 Tax=Lentilactobacillus otakiensis DSM 19908 = JCM 15040 TaxID=1423780 RepID=S4NDG0_9LACO|nr:hypothetical protein [Lentilactobacillus otakiensis]KRL11465.1 hypothetical protein FD05_GL002098 [Lentilactobacillus otakiensis DSM 19908 = JCM 15040]MBZ3776912.1 hypothetical protein [Lentilactobacillus otakiensis]MDV3518380.1 hypothetical protein [Lentilactobacillus otakiensis]GAD16939.1 hypothetical protein LOT_1477 [Lentilactobacillus otakiensis DSM 19908 = JCM 15040]
MLILVFLGIFNLTYGWRQKNRPAVRNVFIFIGILILILAIAAATPQGTDIIEDVLGQ